MSDVARIFLEEIRDHLMVEQSNQVLAHSSSRN